MRELARRHRQTIVTRARHETRSPIGRSVNAVRRLREHRRCEVISKKTQRKARKQAAAMRELARRHRQTIVTRARHETRSPIGRSVNAVRRLREHRRCEVISKKTQRKARKQAAAMRELARRHRRCGVISKKTQVKTNNQQTQTTRDQEI